MQTPADGPDQKLWSGRVTIRQKDEEGRWKVDTEYHLERDHDPGMLKTYLNEAGFAQLALFPSFSLSPVSGEE